jgi:hypothetical protein
MNTGDISSVNYSMSSQHTERQFQADNSIAKKTCSDENNHLER